MFFVVMRKYQIVMIWILKEGLMDNLVLPGDIGLVRYAEVKISRERS
jgi:hypothetical protein